ncbi:MAG: CapA family protein [Bacteroidota bacterium]
MYRSGIKTLKRQCFFWLLLLTMSTTWGFAQVDGQRIKLLFAGDIMGHGPQIEAAEVLENEQYNYHPCFQFIRPLLEEADLAIGNLEVTLPGQPPYRGWPNFRSPDDLAVALRSAGFDVLTTANNHANDAGKTGLVQTLNTLDRNGFYHTGTYRNAFEKALYHPLVIYKKGFKLAFLNYTYGTDLKKHRPPTIVNLIDSVQMKTDLQMARRLKADVIIVLLHWGKEYELEASNKQIRLARQLAECGANLIIGSHPHVVQPIEEYYSDEDGKVENMHLLAYSLGNFISNQQKKYTDGGVLLEIELLKTEKQTLIEDYHYLPVWRYIRRASDGRSNFYCIPIAIYEENPQSLPDFQTKDQHAMLRYARFIRQHLATGDCPERKPSP